MRLLSFEARKLLFYQKGIVVIILYLLSQVGLLLSSTPTNFDTVLHQETYDYYLTRVVGPYTEEKAAFFEEESQLITQAKTSLNSMYQEYYSGLITEEEFQTRAEECQNVLLYDGGFNAIYDQYLYVREGKENRCFLDTNGWEGLLGSGALDIPLVLAVVLLTTPVFCQEYAGKMDTLALTTLNGRKNYVWHKTLLVLFTIAALCLAGAALRCCYYSLRYGLSHGDYTVQSVKIFGSSTKHLSLWSAFCILTILQLYGALFLALIVLAVATLSRKYTLTAFLPSIGILISWMGLPAQLQYTIPTPLPFLLGVGFIHGSSTVADTLTGEKIAIFQELSAEDITRLLFLSIIVCLLSLWAIWWRNRTVLSRCRTHMHHILVVVVISALTLSGCSAINPSMEYVNFNSHTSNTYVTDSFRVYIEESMLWVENLDTGEVTELIRNPLVNGNVGKGVFGIGHNVYYILVQTDSYASKLVDNSGDVSQFSVIQINLDTFEEMVVYEKQQVNTVLGVNIQEGILLESLYGGPFFLTDNSLYVFYNGVRRIDLRTGKTTILDIPTSSNVAFNGCYIYYIDSQYVLCRLDPKNGEVIRWTDVVAYDFCLSEENLYYIDMRLGSELYAMSIDGTERKLLLREPLLSVECEGVDSLKITKQNSEIVLLPL